MLQRIMRTLKEQRFQAIAIKGKKKTKLDEDFASAKKAEKAKPELYAPQGVIICSDKKAFLGMDHGVKPELSDDLIARLKDISKHGLWYEGDGGDIRFTEHLFGSKRNYSGGFDDHLDKSITGHPPEFISALFSNDPPEKMAPHIVGNGTILEAMFAAGDKISSLKGPTHPISKKTIKDFLISISNPSRGLDFLEMADEKATRENAENFIKTVAKEMWPSNWEDYPNPAGKVAKKANDYRDEWLASSQSPNGVYVIGAGHLKAIKKYGRYKIIGGASIK